MEGDGCGVANEISEENGIRRSTELVMDGVGSGVTIGTAVEKVTSSELVSCCVVVLVGAIKDDRTLEGSKLDWGIDGSGLGMKVLRERVSSEDGSGLILPSVRVVDVVAGVSEIGDGEGRKEVEGKKPAVVAKKTSVVAKMSLVSSVTDNVGEGINEGSVVSAGLEGVGDRVSTNEVPTTLVGMTGVTGVVNEMGVADCVSITSVSMVNEVSAALVGVTVSAGGVSDIPNTSVSMMDVPTTVRSIGVETGVSNTSVSTMDVSTTGTSEVNTMEVSTTVGVEVGVSNTSVSMNEVSNNMPVAVGVASEGVVGVAGTGVVAVTLLGVKMLTPNVSSDEDIGSSREAERCTDDDATVGMAVGVANRVGMMVAKSSVCILVVVSSTAEVEGEKKPSDVATPSMDDNTAEENENVDVLIRDCVGVAPSCDDVALVVMESDESGTKKTEVDSVKNTDVLSGKRISGSDDELKGAIGEEADGSGIKMDVSRDVEASDGTMDEEADGSGVKMDVCAIVREVEASDVGMTGPVVAADAKSEGTGVGMVAEEKTREGESLSGADVTTIVGMDVGMSISDGMVKDGNGGNGVGVITMSTGVVSITMKAVVLKGMSMVSTTISTPSSIPILTVGDGRREERREEGREERSEGIGNTLDGSDVGTALVGMFSDGLLLFSMTGVAGSGVGVADTGVGVAGSGVGVASTGVGMAGSGVGVAGSGVGVASTGEGVASSGVGVASNAVRIADTTPRTVEVEFRMFKLGALAESDRSRLVKPV